MEAQAAQPIKLDHKAQQVHVPTDLWAMFVNGTRVLAYKSIEGMEKYSFKKINVTGGEVIEDYENVVIIEKHY